MSTKTKKVSVSSQDKAAGVPAAKKSIVKKPLAKKKKSSAKKAVAKKPFAQTVSFKVEEQTVPVVTVIEKEAHTSHGPVEVHHKYIFIGACRNCDHMPMSANKLVAVLSIAIAILSGIVISKSLPMRFEMPTISMSGFTDWIIPSSRVNNL